jgi:cytochrome o ubiquinol oxidase operon protein cyoD
MADRSKLDPVVHAHGDTHGHGTRRAYVIGFVASAVLTAIPFWLVMAPSLESTVVTAMLVVAFAIAQILVHVRFFLNIDSKGEGGWTLVSFVFTAIIVVITIGGSIWAMYQMNSNMMPTAAVGPMQMP